MTGDNPQPSPDASGSWQFKPGDTVQPKSDSPAPAAQPEQNIPAAQPPQLTENTYPAAPTAEPSNEQPPAVEWSASEYIAHQKSGGWYIIFTLVACALAAGVYLLTKDKISTGAIAIVALILGVYGARKPRVLQYHLDGAGLTIGQKNYAYDQFRSFSVMDEGAFSNIAFMPLKRFMPLITVYYDPKDEDKIVQLLADRLPMEDLSHDPIDRLMHHIRF